ncbi:MAG TPA: DUF2795 domain-containing protein [Candidatus Paceibacterota bacterium]
MQTTTEELQQSLNGLNYPVFKTEIIERARENGASKEVMSELQSIPEREYFDANDVLEACGG